MESSTTFLQVVEDILLVLHLDSPEIKTTDEIQFLLDACIEEEDTVVDFQHQLQYVLLWKDIIERLYELRKQPSLTRSIPWRFPLLSINKETDSYHYYYVSQILDLCNLGLFEIISFLQKGGVCEFHAFNYDSKVMRELIYNIIRPCLYLLSHLRDSKNSIYNRRVWIKMNQSSQCPEFIQRLEDYTTLFRSVAFFLDGCCYSLLINWFRKGSSPNKIISPERKEAIKLLTTSLFLLKDVKDLPITVKLIRSCHIMIGLIRADYARHCRLIYQANQIYLELQKNYQWDLDSCAIENQQFIPVSPSSVISASSILPIPLFPDKETLTYYTDCASGIDKYLPSYRLPPPLSPPPLPSSTS